MKVKLYTSRNKLFIGFVIIVFICILVILANQTLKDKQLQMKNELLAEKNILIEIQKINRLGLVADNEGAYYFLSTAARDKNGHLQKYKNNVEAVNKELERFRALLSRPENMQSLSVFEQNWNNYVQDNERAFQFEKEGRVDESRAAFIEISFNETRQSLNSMREQQKELADKKELYINRTNFIIQQVDTAITVAFILFTIALGWILSRKIELEHHMKAQKQFFQNTSHELKTPLMSIQGYAQAILDGTIDGEQAGDSLKIIINESDRLKKMVTDMILLSRIENEENSFEWQAVPLEYLLEESIFRINPLLKEKGVRVDIHQTFLNGTRSPLVKVDSEKCLQALLNILSNALRHAAHAIDISILERERQVWIDIKDDGEGIPEEVLPNLFQRFFKGKNGENGLGLAISRAIIEQSGGSIAAWNDQDGGAVFRIMLPTIHEKRK